MAPLRNAAINGSGPMVRLLLEAGADANATLPGGETVLMTAARTGRVDAIDALLEHGASVNAREGARGQTALMWAAAAGQVGVVRLLIEAGADVRAADDEGVSAVDLARTNGHSEVAAALIAAGVNPSLPEGIPEEAMVYVEFEVAGQLRRYSVSSVSQTLVNVRTTFTKTS